MPNVPPPPVPPEETTPTTPSSTEPRRKADSHKWKPVSAKANTLPPNLMSTTNQQKVPTNLQVICTTQNVDHVILNYLQVKQQLPLKLAATTKSPGPPPGAATVQQILPLKLRETAGDGRRITVGSPPPGYTRLANDPAAPSESASPPPSSSPAPTHARTGSSPAMMEHSQSHPGSPARTHSFPKTEEKVIFF